MLFPTEKTYEREVKLYPIPADSGTVIVKLEKGYNIPAAFMLKNFTEKLLSAKDDDIIYISIDEKGRRINVNSLDPADYSQGVVDSFYSTILMSGTFRPMGMFANLLGLNGHESLEVDGDAASPSCNDKGHAGRRQGNKI